MCYHPQAEKKCPFFAWLADYEKVVAKKLKEDLQAAVPYEGHGETKALPYQGNGESKGLVEMKLKSRLYEEERMDLKMDKHEGRMDLKMDKLIGLVQLLVVLCLVIVVIVLLGVVVLITK